MINGTVLLTDRQHRLHNHLLAAACSRRLLVATDFDGTLVELDDNPDDVWLPPGAAELLTALAAHPGVTVAVLSGRSLGDLRKRFGDANGIRLIGSHGAEPEHDDQRIRLHPTQDHLLRTTTEQLRGITTVCAGTWVERKPTSVVFHYRTAGDECAANAVRAVLDGPGTSAGIHLRLGKDCLELAVVEVTKGVALDRLRHEIAAERVVFMGDDVTDEDGFRVLTHRDIGIKVGPGPSRAEYRAATTGRALSVLEELLLMRDRFQRDYPQYVN
ncbi:MAG: trehalose-phosphatase [Acidimicrobiia bacterium]